jgi:pimeloyl-ACP methyl ester carboxylesterase
MKRISMKQIGAMAISLLVLGAFLFITWANQASPPTGSALQALQTNPLVVVSEESGWITFAPAEHPLPSAGFIFYPGGRVDFRAYAPVLRAIARRGFFVALLPMPLNLAFFNINAAAQVMALHPEIDHWALGGHSLGGVAAASFTANHDEIEGLVFWASYPADDALADRSLKVLSIYGTSDGLSTPAKIDESRALLPPGTEFIPIEGGNHAQFGSYGPQAGDHPAEISPEEQWAQIVDATVSLLERISE